MRDKEEELIYLLADTLKQKRALVDSYVATFACEKFFKSKMSGYAISKAEELFRAQYPDNSED